MQTKLSCWQNMVQHTGQTEGDLCTFRILNHGDGDGALGAAQALVGHLHRQVQHARVHLEHDVHPALVLALLSDNASGLCSSSSLLCNHKGVVHVL